MRRLGALDLHRAEELSAFDVDEAGFAYSRAAKELWKFSNRGDIEIAARATTPSPTRDKHSYV